MDPFDVVLLVVQVSFMKSQSFAKCKSYYHKFNFIML